MVKFRQIKNSLKRYLKLCKSLSQDKRTPKISKALLAISIGYFFLPFDLIPDFIPLLGQLDDLIIIPLLVYLSFKFIPKKVYQEHYNNIFK